MKKLALLLLLVPFIFGCQPYYVQPSEPYLNINGKWKIIDILPTYSEGVQIVDPDFFAVSPFVVTSTSNDGWIIQHDTTNIESCYFYKTGYRWEFETNLLILKDDGGKIIGEYYVNYGNIFYNKQDFFLTEKYTGINIGGKFHLSYNANGSNRANDLWITVPELNINVTGPERSMERVITQSITLFLTR